MPAPRKPNATNILNGAWQKNPQRERPPTVEDDEPASAQPPALELISFEQAWADIIEMAPVGVLRRRDEGAIWECARLHMVIRNTTILALRSNRMPEVENNVSTAYRSWLAKIGCTPVDSNHVAAPHKGKGKGDFE